MNDERNQQDHDAIITILQKVTAMEVHLAVLNGRTAKNEESTARQDREIIALQKDMGMLGSRTMFWGKVVSFILVVIALIEGISKFVH